MNPKDFTKYPRNRYPYPKKLEIDTKGAGGKPIDFTPLPDITVYSCDTEIDPKSLGTPQKQAGQVVNLGRRK
jgi:hypothetical protein